MDNQESIYKQEKGTNALAGFWNIEIINSGTNISCVTIYNSINNVRYFFSLVSWTIIPLHPTTTRKFQLLVSLLSIRNFLKHLSR